MEPTTIDRLSWVLANVQPRLASVSSSEQLYSWAQAALEQAAAGSGLGQAGQRSPGVAAVTDGAPDLGGAAVNEASAPAAAFGLRHWEQALSDALHRLQAAGEIRPDADVSALGAAFAALVYGGLLLTQVAGSPRPLRAAMDMALAQVSALDGH